MVEQIQSGAKHRSRRRTEAEISLRILEIANGEILPSKLLLKANLNTGRMARYTDLLVAKGFLTKKMIETRDGKIKETFLTTQEGLEYITILRELKHAVKRTNLHRRPEPLGESAITRAFE